MSLSRSQNFLILTFLVLTSVTLIRSSFLERKKSEMRKQNGKFNTKLVITTTPEPETTPTVLDNRDFIVSLQTMKEFFPKPTDICIGVILTSTAILAAGHCLVTSEGTKKRPKWIKAMAEKSPGYRKLSRGFIGEEIILHEGYTHKHLANDIGIIKLNRDMKYLTYYKAGNLTSERPEIGMQCTVRGWGRIFWNGPMVEMDPVTLNVVESDSCFLGNETVEGGEWICTERLPTKDLETYVVGSGAPLMCDNVIYGIASHVLYKADTTYFVNIHHYREWILKNHAYLPTSNILMLLGNAIVGVVFDEIVRIN